MEKIRHLPKFMQEISSKGRQQVQVVDFEAKHGSAGAPAGSQSGRPVRTGRTVRWWKWWSPRARL